MKVRDQKKLLDINFVIIRCDYINLLIKCKVKNRQNWHIMHRGFEDRADLDRYADSLLNTIRYIED